MFVWQNVLYFLDAPRNIVIQATDGVQIFYSLLALKN